MNYYRYSACCILLLILCLQLSGQVKVETFIDSIDASGGVKWHEEHLYVANFGESLNNANGSEVYKIAKDKTITLFASGLQGASGNDFDSQGNLFQSSIAGGTVTKITPQGISSFFASQNITCNVGIVINAADELIVCNCCGNSGNTLTKVNSAGSAQTFVASTLLRCPNGITQDDDGNIYVSNFENGNIIKITPSGTASILATTPGTPSSAPSNGHITFSSRDQILYVASHGAHALFSLTLDGVLTKIAGTGVRGNTDGDEFTATFSRPNGIALNATEDTMFVNSSIPITDIGGRPLNPSKIRMITGFRDASSVTPGQENLNFKLSLSPNPTNQFITIALEGNRVIDKVTIINFNGKVILEKGWPQGQKEMQFNVSEYITGNYIVLAHSDYQIFSKKFLVQ